MAPSRNLKPLAGHLNAVIRAGPPAVLPVWEPLFRLMLSEAKVNLTDLLREEEITLETLALACQSGFLRREAFEELMVNRSTTWLTKCLRRWGVPRDQVQDELSRLYLHLWEKALARYDSSRLFRPWVARVARNCWIGWIRSLRRSQSLDQVQEPLDGGLSPVQAAEAEELRRLILDAVPDPEQKAAISGILDGMSVLQVAESMDVPKTKVYRLLFRARARVRTALRSTVGLLGDQIR